MHWAAVEAAVGSSTVVVAGTSTATAGAAAAAETTEVGGRGVGVEPSMLDATGGRGVRVEPNDDEAGGRGVGIEPSSRATASLESVRAAVAGGGGKVRKWRERLEPAE